MDPIFVLTLWILSALIGAAIGSRKGRTIGGTVMGALLGPIGWLLLVIGPDLRPKCPECKGAVPKGARKCFHCSSEISG